MTDLLSMLLHSRTQAHVFHLRVSPNGLAPHLALQTYYEDIIGLIDGIAEGYQGMNGLLEFKAVKGIDNDADKDNIISYFEDLVKFKMIPSMDNFNCNEECFINRDGTLK